MRTLTITIINPPGKGMAIDCVPNSPENGNEAENQILACLQYACNQTLQVIAVKAKSGTIVQAEHLSPIWEDINKRLSVYRENQ